MAEHQHDTNAGPLWNYFQSIIDWGKRIFPDYYREMKGVDWGRLYNEHKDRDLNPVEMAADVKKYMADEDVTKKSGIFEYLVSGKAKEKVRCLNIRKFSNSDKRTAFTKFKGICQSKTCGKVMKSIKEAEADHIKPWRCGGKTVLENCNILCIDCNRRKGGK